MSLSNKDDIILKLIDFRFSLRISPENGFLRIKLNKVPGLNKNASVFMRIRRKNSQVM